MAEPTVPPYLHPPADLRPHRRDVTKEEAPHTVHAELGLRWYHTAAPARAAARRLMAETGELHFVVALDYGTVIWVNGTVRREAVTGADGDVIGSKMFLPFTFPALAAFIDAVRLSPFYGPSCLNMYEEVNVDRARRVGFDLEFELSHERKNGERDHEQRAATLWPVDFRAVACTPELFLRRILVDRVLPALNELAGSRLTTRDLHVLDSSSPTKLSFHVATPLVLATADDVLLFSRWMRVTFENGDAPLAPLLDCGVYASCGNMRLPLNRKPAKAGSSSDKPWLRPVSSVGNLEFAATHDGATPSESHGHTLELLRHHAWTWVGSNYYCISDRLDAWGGDSGSPREEHPKAPLGLPATSMWPAGKRSATPAAAVPAAVLELVGRHLGVPASEVRVASASRPSALAEREAFAGRITCANDNGVSASVFVSPRGNVYADTGDGANIATLLVERALSPARADSFSDWFAVGGALHSIDSSLFDVWDRFSRQSEGKYPGRDKLMTRWCQFNGAHSLGTLVFMARGDNPEETRAILRGNRSLLLGQLGSKGVEGILKPSTPSPPPDGEATASPVRKTSVHKTVVALERRVLRAVLGDTASEPVIAAGATSWNGAWCAPSGRRCAHGAVHFGETTFETFVAATRACTRPGCGGLVGGGFWRDRNTCGKCRRVDAPMPDSPSPCGGLVGTKKPPMVLYELCHGCGVQSEPMFVGRMNAVPAKKASLPTAMSVYAAAVDKRSPSWELTPCPPFNTSRHTFTALFTVTECGRYVHKDGHRRLLGVTSGGDVLLGVKAKESNKPAQTPYAWTSVAHWFRKALAAWFSEEHAAVVARLPAPRTTQAGVPTWTLPCCAVAGQCGRVKCRTVTDEPWRYLRQLRAHGVNAD